MKLPVHLIASLLRPRGCVAALTAALLAIQPMGNISAFAGDFIEPTSPGAPSETADAAAAPLQPSPVASQIRQESRSENGSPEKRITLPIPSWTPDRLQLASVSRSGWPSSTATHPQSKSSKKLVIILVTVGAGVAAAVLLAGKKSGSGSSGSGGNGPTITAGQPTVGP